MEKLGESNRDFSPYTWHRITTEDGGEERSGVGTGDLKRLTRVVVKPFDPHQDLPYSGKGVQWKPRPTSTSR